VLRAGAEAAVQVERRDRATRALPCRLGAGDQDDRPVVALDEPRRDDPDHPLVPLLARDDVAAGAAPRRGPRLDLLDRLAQDPLLHRLPLAVQVLELAREQLRLVLRLRQQQVQRRLRPAEPPRSVDARREPEADRAFVDRRGVDARDLHQRAQSRFLGPPQALQPGERERAVLVEQRHDVGHGRERDEIEVLLEERVGRSQQRLGELPDDARAAEAGERVVALQRRDDRAVGERVSGPVVVGDDDLEPEPARTCDLCDGRDPAVDGEDELDPVGGQPFERLAVQAVALVEAARQVPGDVRVELAQEQDGERGRADPVGVVVAVDADPLARRDRGTQRGDRLAHVAEQQGIVAGQRACEERAGVLRIAEAAADEDARRRLGDLERTRERAHVRRGAGSDRPVAVDHARTVASASDGNVFESG
jgi:hypothetical protein